MKFTFENAVEAADFIIANSDKPEGMVVAWRDQAKRGTATFGMLKELVDRANKEAQA